MKFPPDYPYSPPSIRFMTKVWHPNVYEVSNIIVSVIFTMQNNKQKQTLSSDKNIFDIKNTLMNAILDLVLTLKKI